MNQPRRSSDGRLAYIILPVTPFAQNCSIVWCTESKCAAVVDPGGDLPRLTTLLESLELELDRILITHAHLDHAGGTAELARRYGLPIYGPQREDQFLIDSLPAQCRQFGFNGERFQPDHWLEDEDQVTLGELCFDVVHCPGHTPGHIVFIEQQAQFALVGDVLFQGSIGRSDFPRGNHQQLLQSIHRKLLPRGEHIQFVPGHGPMSTFGHEQRSNPFLRDKRFS
jgi:glyoxylase-like metal-dependent hydrolase (beta-lactamase superfamily II)